MARRERFWTRVEERRDGLVLAAIVDDGHRGASITHVHVDPAGRACASSCHLRLPPSPARAVDAIMAGRAPDGSPAPGPLPGNVPGWPSPRWSEAHFSDLARILRGDAGGPAAQALSRSLDPDAVSVAVRGMANTGLTIKDFNALSASPGASRDVRDLLDRHPWIAEKADFRRIVADRLEGPWPKASPDERARALVTRFALRERYRSWPEDVDPWPLSTPAVRRLAGLARGQEPTMKQMGFMSALPPDWIPEPGTLQWDMCLVVSAVAGNPWCASADRLPATLAGCGGDFVALAERIHPRGKAADREWRDAVANAILVTDDAYHGFVRDVVGPALSLANERATRREQAAIAAEMLGVSGVASVVEASRRWHVQERAIRLSIEPLDRRTWPAVTKPFRSRSKVDVVALTSAAALDDEGVHGFDVDGVMGMGHCVGSRAGACSQGHVHILSVRRSSGRSFRRLSTVEVTFDGGVPRVREHKGPGNGPPPRDAEAAVAEWVDAVTDGRLRASPEAVARRERVRDRPRSEALERAVAAWSALLKRRYRNLDATDSALAVLALLEKARAPAPERRNAGKPERRDGEREAGPGMRP